MMSSVTSGVETPINRAARNVLLGLFLCAALTPRPVAAEEPNLGLLTPAEIAFLMEHAPEINHLVSSGAAVVYGNVIQPPILVTVNRDRIYVGGFQVTPREPRIKEFLAQKRVEEIHQQYYSDHRAGNRNLDGPIQDRGIEMRKAGQIKSFQLENKGAHPRMDIVVGDQKWFAFLDACPWSVSRKYRFILTTLVRGHALRRDAEGKDAALGWLRSRLDDLERMKILGSYSIEGEDETMKVRFSCNWTEAGFGFYGPRTPRDFFYEKEWKSKQPTTQRETDDILRRLGTGELLIYSYDFDKHLTLDPRHLKTLKDMRDGQGEAKPGEVLQTTFELTPEHAARLLEELR